MAKGSSELIKEEEVDTFWFFAIPSMLVILDTRCNVRVERTDIARAI